MSLPVSEVLSESSKSISADTTPFRSQPSTGFAAQFMLLLSVAVQFATIRSKPTASLTLTHQRAEATPASKWRPAVIGCSDGFRCCSTVPADPRRSARSPDGTQQWSQRLSEASEQKERARGQQVVPYGDWEALPTQIEHRVSSSAVVAERPPQFAVATLRHCETARSGDV